MVEGMVAEAHMRRAARLARKVVVKEGRRWLDVAKVVEDNGWWRGGEDGEVRVVRRGNMAM